MKPFEYSDEDISLMQYLIAIPSISIGIVILIFQTELARITVALDGLLLIFIGGLGAVFFIWLVAKFAAGFEKRTFFDYTSSILTKPAAIVICFVFSLLYIGIAAFEIRKLTDITRHYLLDETPVEALSLSFLFIVIYAVAGSRAGLFRLNMLFLPFVLVVSLVVALFNIPLIEMNNIQPILKTNSEGYVKGISMMFALFISGAISIVLFYTSLVRTKEKTPKMAALGTTVPVILFMMFYFVAIGVFGNTVTANLLSPSIELGKAVHIPGGVLERFESIFLIIWMMAIFNITTMVFDLAVLTLNYIFKNTKKIKLIFILTPIIFFISMVPENILESTAMGKYTIYGLFIFSVGITFILFIVAKLRGAMGK